MKIDSGSTLQQARGGEGGRQEESRGEEGREGVEGEERGELGREREGRMGALREQHGNNLLSARKPISMRGLQDEC